MDPKLAAFQEAVLVRNVVARFVDRVGMEHDTPEALKAYLHEHPNADPSNHSVKKKGQPKNDNGKKPDTGAADQEASHSAARTKELDGHMSEMKSLKAQVDNANPTAKKKFGRAYDKMFESGEKAAKAAEKLVSKYKDAFDPKDKSEDAKQFRSTMEMLHSATVEWDRNKDDHRKHSQSHAHEKLQQAEQTHGYAKELEKWVRHVGRTLKGEHDVAD